MNSAVITVAIVILGFWAIALWLIGLYDDFGDPFEIDEDF